MLTVFPIEWYKKRDLSRHSENTVESRLNLFCKEEMKAIELAFGITKPLPGFQVSKKQLRIYERATILPKKKNPVHYIALCTDMYDWSIWTRFFNGFLEKYNIRINVFCEHWRFSCVPC